MNIVVVCLLVAQLVVGEVLNKDDLLQHLDAFFTSWVQKDHGGMGSIKQAQLFGRNIQMHVVKVSDIHVSGVTVAQVTVSDVESGKSVTKTSSQATRDAAVAVAAIEAAEELFREMEKEGLVDAATLLKNNQVQLCNDHMSAKVCEMYAQRNMCDSDVWREFVKENCFYTCFNCGKGWN